MPYFNSLKDYVDDNYSEVRVWTTNKFVGRLIQVLPRLVLAVIMDAFIEIVLLVVLGFIFYDLSQGKDLIVSFFEPKGLYNSWRLVITAITIVLYALCMWLIPAFLFEWQIRKYKGQEGNFHKHLFFVHRALPLLPFWIFSIFVYHTIGRHLLFGAMMLLEVCLIYSVNHLGWFKRNKRKIIGAGIGLAFLLCIYLAVRYQVGYSDVKLAWSFLLILLSFLFYWVMKTLDARIVMIKEADDRRSSDDPEPDNRLISAFKKFKSNTLIYASIFVFLVAMMVMCLFKFNLKVLAPESLLLFVLSFYVFFIDILHYIASFSNTSRFIVNSLILVLVVTILVVKFNVRSQLYDMSYLPGGSVVPAGQDLPGFDDYYKIWKQRIINRPVKTQPFPIFLISGEGGGSRAGLWFSDALMTIDLNSGGRFKNHIFSISTVSGSSIGLGAMLSYWKFLEENNRIPASKWIQYPERVFHYNFVGGATLELTTKDLWKSLLPGVSWADNRNKELQLEEAICIQRSLYEAYKDTDLPRFRMLNRYDSVPGMYGPLYMTRDYLDYYLYKDSNNKVGFKGDMPLALINSCRSEDGRRGVFSAIRMDSSQFMDAIDLSRYIYGDSFGSDKSVVCGLRKAITLGAVCNTSELFPIFNGPAYISDLGYFVDAGYHDNSGLKTTIEVYHQLKERLKVDFDSTAYRIYILYIKNGKNEKKYYPGKVGIESADLQPVNAITNMPFSGSASYFEEEAKRQIRGPWFIQYQLDYGQLLDSTKHVAGIDGGITTAVQDEMMSDLIDGDGGELNFPLARWLSNFTISRIAQRCEVEYNTHQTVLKNLIDGMNATEPSPNR